MLCVCGKAFTESGRRRHCSNACKQRAYRNRAGRYDSSGSKPGRPILRYHGGKFRLAAWIINHFPPHTRYIEPFAGAASVFLTKSAAPVEVLNDKNGRLVNLLRVLADPKTAKQLTNLVSSTPYSHQVYYEARSESGDPVVDAARMLVLGHQGHGSTAASGGKLSGWRRGVRSSTSNSAKEWAALRHHIDAWSQRLRGTFIECDDALNVIRRWDRPGALFYVDPPYLHSTRSGSNGYAYEMSGSDHEVLAQTLSSLKGYAVLSSYPSALYDRLYPTWTCVQKPTVADKGKAVQECLWISPNAQQQNQLNFGGDI